MMWKKPSSALGGMDEEITNDGEDGESKAGDKFESHTVEVKRGFFLNSPQVLLREPVQPEIEREVDARVKAVVVDCYEQMS